MFGTAMAIARLLTYHKFEQSTVPEQNTSKSEKAMKFAFKIIIFEITFTLTLYKRINIDYVVTSWAPSSLSTTVKSTI